MNELIILIIDDEIKVTEALRYLLINHLKITEKLIICTANSVADGVKMIEQHKPDLVFLDIQMPGENGLTLFSHFNDNLSFEVVITTAYDEYALEVLNKYNCLHYLMKPINIAELQLTYEKFKQKQREQPFLKIIKNNQKRELINVNDIYFCKANDNYCDIYLKDKKFLISRTLGFVESRLNHPQFIRVNRSFLININHVKAINVNNKVSFKEDVIINKEMVDFEVIVSASKMKDLRAFDL